MMVVCSVDVCNNLRKELNRMGHIKVKTKGQRDCEKEFIQFNPESNNRVLFELATKQLVSWIFVVATNNNKQNNLTEIILGGEEKRQRFRVIRDPQYCGNSIFSRLFNGQNIRFEYNRFWAIKIEERIEMSGKRHFDDLHRFWSVCNGCKVGVFRLWI